MKASSLAVGTKFRRWSNSLSRRKHLVISPGTGKTSTAGHTAEVLCLAFSKLRACFEKASDLADRAGKVLAGSGSGPSERRDPGYFGGVMTKRLGNRAQMMKATGRIVAIAVLSIQWH